VSLLEVCCDPESFSIVVQDNIAALCLQLIQTENAEYLHSAIPSCGVFPLQSANTSEQKKHPKTNNMFLFNIIFVSVWLYQISGFKIILKAPFMQKTHEYRARILDILSLEWVFEMEMFVFVKLNSDSILFVRSLCKPRTMHLGLD
jgi:hypothetical protein